MTYRKRKDQRTYPWRLRLGERQTLIFVGDVIATLLALLIGHYFWVQGPDWMEPTLKFLRNSPPTWYLFLPIVWLILLVDIYDLNRASDWKATIKSISIAAIVGLFIYMVVYFTSEPRSLPRRGVAIFLLSTSMLTLTWRLFYIRVFTTPEFLRRVLLVGAGVTGQALLKVYNELIPPPFYLIGMIDDDPGIVGDEVGDYKVLGNSERLLEIIAEESISDIIVAISGKMGSPMFRALLDAQEQGVEITRMPVAYEELLGRVPIHFLEADWLLRSFVDEARVSGFYQLGKRLMDVAGGLVGVLILIPLFPFVALAIALESGFPVVFFQTRTGRGGRPYTIIKFRTMRKADERENDALFTQKDDERTTKVGKFLRKSHLDEWPQFINVLKGEMSVVGPRPEVPELVEIYQEAIPFFRARLLVKPGIAGWAQVNQNYAATIKEYGTKLEYDLFYIKNRNLLLDILVILRTFGTIFGFRGR